MTIDKALLTGSTGMPLLKLLEGGRSAGQLKIWVTRRW